MRHYKLHKLASIFEKEASADLAYNFFNQYEKLTDSFYDLQDGASAWLEEKYSELDDLEDKEAANNIYMEFARGMNLIAAKIDELESKLENASNTSNASKIIDLISKFNTGDLIYIPDVVKSSNEDVEQAKKEILKLHEDGVIQLRLYGGFNRISDEDIKLSPIGAGGNPLVMALKLK